MQLSISDANHHPLNASQTDDQLGCLPFGQSGRGLWLKRRFRSVLVLVKGSRAFSGSMRGSVRGSMKGARKSSLSKSTRAELSLTLPRSSLSSAGDLHFLQQQPPQSPSSSACGSPLKPKKLTEQISSTMSHGRAAKKLKRVRT
jgi:hypothetical protein